MSSNDYDSENIKRREIVIKILIRLWTFNNRSYYFLVSLDN